MPTSLRLLLILFILLSCPASGQAGLFDSPADELRAVLAKPDTSIDDYPLPVDDLNTFYSARAFKPAWDFHGKDNEAAFQNFLNSLELQITYHGLSADAYPLDLARHWHSSNEAGASLKTELLVTSMILRLAHDLHGDSTDLANLYPGWKLSRGKMDIPARLAEAVEKNTLSSFLSSLVPTRKEYADLAKILSDLTAAKAKGEYPVIDKGPSLRPNDRNDRVFRLRQRLEAENYIAPQPPPATDANFFDKDMETALKTFQERHGLDTDGHVGEKTREALNTSLDDLIDQVRANMERWRHIPDDFPPQNHAIVNIASMSIEIQKENAKAYSGPVVVGRVDRKTPFIVSSIHHMIVNPSWHVPSKIARKDILPKLRKDPHYLEKLGFIIKDSEDDPHGENIDWKKISDRAFQFQLRQAPGEQNSLGRLKFDFENDFAVYMHGTPHQELFAKSERAFSSGCVRLRDPTQVAETVFSDNKTSYSAQQIEEMIADGKTKWINLTHDLPVYFLYWTVYRNADGTIQYRKDIYDYDRQLIEMLDL